MRGLLLFAVVLLLMAMQSAFAAHPMWAKKATAFPELCHPGKTRECKPVRIPAPDGKSNVEVRYRKDFGNSAYDWVLQAYLLVTTPGASAREAALIEDFPASGYYNVELLWSPDSHAFFVNGSNAGVWDSMYVYLADDPTEPRNITEEAQHDMLKDFPPCKAAYPNAVDAGGCEKSSRTADEEICAKGQLDPKYNPDYNMVGIDWVNASTILVMAEVPCDTSQGGIMCQVMGYELQVPTGRIIERIDAKHLKLEWQKSMAWKFRIPDPPRYCE